MWGRRGGSWWPLGTAGTQPTALGGIHSGAHPHSCPWPPLQVPPGCWHQREDPAELPHCRLPGHQGPGGGRGLSPAGWICCWIWEGLSASCLELLPAASQSLSGSLEPTARAQELGNVIPKLFGEIQVPPKPSRSHWSLLFPPGGRWGVREAPAFCVQLFPREKQHPGDVWRRIPSTEPASTQGMCCCSSHQLSWRKGTNKTLLHAQHVWEFG